jgi:hypothetical protein
VSRTVEMSPIAVARETRQRSRDALAQAREALVEAVRQSGTAGARVIDDVAMKEGLLPATVQEALWALLNEQALATDQQGNVTAGERGLPA